MPANDRPRLPPARITAQEFRVLAAGRRQGRKPATSRAGWGRSELPSEPFKLTLPFIPPSVNKLFTTVRDPQTGIIKRVLTQNARRVRRLICAMIEQQRDPACLYELRVDVYLSVWTKAGKVRRIDLTNRVKFLEDCVCGALGIDDSHVFRVVLEKHDSPHERTVLQLLEIAAGESREAA